jgi:NADPH:quinone reductase-like Zn-dependent oxidoreductase
MMKALRLHSYGAPLDVLHLEETSIPDAGPGQIRVRVHACALNPADGALCQGWAPSTLPRGIGLDVSGTVDAVGKDVTNVGVGDLVFGVPDFMGQPSAGASEYAILAVWVPVPNGLSPLDAAALPMAVETATRTLDLLGLKKSQTILINGGGTMVGFAAVQMALLRGAHVITTVGKTYADRLRDLGAKVTSYGDGMVDRVRELAGGAPDLVLQTARASGVLLDLIQIVDGNPQRVLSIGDLDAAKFGVRTTGNEPDLVPRYDVLGHFAQLAAEGRFTIPVARTFSLEDWREALEISLSGRAHGNLLLQPDNAS